MISRGARMRENGRTPLVVAAAQPSASRLPRVVRRVTHSCTIYSAPASFGCPRCRRSLARSAKSEQSALGEHLADFPARRTGFSRRPDGRPTNRKRVSAGRQFRRGSRAIPVYPVPAGSCPRRRWGLRARSPSGVEGRWSAPRRRGPYGPWKGPGPGRDPWFQRQASTRFS